MKFRGKIEQLKSILSSIDPHGEWIDSRRRYQFRATNDGILNWWPSSGTVNFQGPDRAAEELEDILFGALKLTGRQNAPAITSQTPREAKIIEGDSKVVRIGSPPRRVLPGSCPR